MSGFGDGLSVGGLKMDFGKATAPGLSKDQLGVGISSRLERSVSGPHFESRVWCRESTKREMVWNVWVTISKESLLGMESRMTLGRQEVTSKEGPIS